MRHSLAGGCWGRGIGRRDACCVSCRAVRTWYNTIKLREVVRIFRRLRMQPRVQQWIHSKTYFFLRGLVERYLRHDVGSLAAEATYYLILALVPFLIVALNMVLYFAAAQIDHVFALLAYLPAETHAFLWPVIVQIIASRSTTVLSVAMILALWSASKGVDTLVRAMDLVFETDKNRQSYWRVKLKSIVFTLLIVGSMLTALGVLVFGNAIVHAVAGLFGPSYHFLALWDIVKYLVPFVVMVAVVAVFYRYAPGPVREGGRRLPWRFAFTGSGVATLLWLAMTGAYSYYVTNMANMGATYGSLVGLMILFIWFNLTSLILIMGAELIVVGNEMKLVYDLPGERLVMFSDRYRD